MDQRGSRLREEFSRQFLHGMSDRIQSDFGPKQLQRFLNNKFEFFLEAMGKQGLLLLERGKGPLTRIIRQDITVLRPLRL